MQSFSEAPLKKCPQCKKKKLQRLIGTGAAILFKGAGFYQTDYRSDSYKSAAKQEEAKQTTETTPTAATPTPSATKDTNSTAKANTGQSTGKSAKS